MESLLLKLQIINIFGWQDSSHQGNIPLLQFKNYYFCLFKKKHCHCSTKFRYRFPISVKTSLAFIFHIYANLNGYFTFFYGFNALQCRPNIILEEKPPYMSLVFVGMFNIESCKQSNKNYNLSHVKFI